MFFGFGGLLSAQSDPEISESRSSERQLNEETLGQTPAVFANENVDAYPLQPLPSWLYSVNVGYDRGFVIAARPNAGIDTSQTPFLLRIGGLGQFRATYFESENDMLDLNQFQLKRARLIASGNVFSPDFEYFIQLDGRSSAGDEFRLLDYFMTFDVGRRWFDLDRKALVFKAGRSKIPFTFARDLSAREFQFADRSMASTFFDLNRSLGVSLGGETDVWNMPFEWEASLFNGFVTGGAETGSAGELDNNVAYSAHAYVFPLGDWGTSALSDFEWHESLASRVGAGYAGTTNERAGPTEFNNVRVVDSGSRLANLLPGAVEQYDINTFCVNASAKYRGWSVTSEYYFRIINGFQGDDVPELFDHGFWLQAGKFVIPRKLELLTRWSRVAGTSGTLGNAQQSADEIAGGAAWYFKGQNAKLVIDATHLNGAPVDSAALDMSPTAAGWLLRTQIQFAF